MSSKASKQAKCEGRKVDQDSKGGDGDGETLDCLVGCCAILVVNDGVLAVKDRGAVGATPGHAPDSRQAPFLFADFQANWFGCDRLVYTQCYTML